MSTKERQATACPTEVSAAHSFDAMKAQLNTDAETPPANVTVFIAYDCLSHGKLAKEFCDRLAHRIPEMLVNPCFWSWQLGEFESGMLAAWFGAVTATVVGGAGTLLVVALWSVMFPTLRRRQRLLTETYELGRSPD
jgi:hypothetical protein